MASGQDWPELSEQLVRLKDKKKRMKRLARAIVMILVSGLILVAGIIVIGDSQTYEETSSGPRYWDSFQLEVGIFLTLVGAILVALSSNHLIASWKILRP
jgi:hypothetical protein